MSLEQQIGALVKASENLTGAVNGKIGEIDTELKSAIEQYNNFIKGADSKYQKILSSSGKFYGSHLVMGVSPPNYCDPSHADYKAGQKNGIILWKIGEGNDSLRIRSIGFQGDVILTRYGYENYQKGAFRALRQYTDYYSYIESGLSIALEIMTVNGIQYRVLSSGMSGGGDVIFNGLLAFDGRAGWGDAGSIRDENFGRYVNTKDGAVYDSYATIASLPYDPLKREF